MTNFKKVMFYDDERSIGNSIIVTLNHGWRFVNQGDSEHVAGFDATREAAAAIRQAAKCACSQCESESTHETN